MRGNKSTGFTLVEIFIAIAVVAVIAAVAYPSYAAYRERMDISLVIKDFVQIDMEMARYYASYGEFPPDLTTIGMQRDDPWGTPYQYLNMATTSGNGPKRKDRNLVPINTDFDLYSNGPDGRTETPLTSVHSRDDIIRGSNGEFIGPASDY